jgi:hypothetical protein
MSEVLQERVRVFLEQPIEPMPVISEMLPHYARTGSIPSDRELRELLDMCAEELESAIPNKPIEERDGLSECVSILRDIVGEARGLNSA